MELSVIIVSYNVRHYLEYCLKSVFKATEKIKSEVIVIDNNSKDDSCLMAESLFPGVVMIRNTANEGFSRACNQGLKIARGEFIVLLNPDTLVCETTLLKCLEFMRSRPDAGASGVKMLNGSGRYLRESKRAIPYPLTAFFKLSGLTSLFPRSELFSRYYMEHADRDKVSQIEVLPGAFMFLRKRAIDAAGMLDENYFMYGEDIDLSIRILKAGYKIYYLPEAMIIHYKGKSPGSIKSSVSFYRSMMVFARNNFRKERPLLYAMIIKPSIYVTAAAGLLKMAVQRFLSGRAKTGLNDEMRFLQDLYGIRGKALIASGFESYLEIKGQVVKSGAEVSIAGRVRPAGDNCGREAAGEIPDLESILRTTEVKAVIYSFGSLGLQTIAESINTISGMRVKVYIVPA